MMVWFLGNTDYVARNNHYHCHRFGKCFFDQLHRCVERKRFIGYCDGDGDFSVSGDATTAAAVSFQWYCERRSCGFLSDNSVASAEIVNGSVANEDLTNDGLVLGNTDMSLGTTTTTVTGLASVSSTSFTGDLTGNVSGNVTGFWKCRYCYSFCRTLVTSVLAVTRPPRQFRSTVLETLIWYCLWRRIQLPRTRLQLVPLIRMRLQLELLVQPRLQMEVWIMKT